MTTKNKNSNTKMMMWLLSCKLITEDTFVSFAAIRTFLVRQRMVELHSDSFSSSSTTSRILTALSSSSAMMIIRNVLSLVLNSTPIVILSISIPVNTLMISRASVVFMSTASEGSTSSSISTIHLSFLVFSLSTHFSFTHIRLKNSLLLHLLQNMFPLLLWH